MSLSSPPHAVCSANTLLGWVRRLRLVLPMVLLPGVAQAGLEVCNDTRAEQAVVLGYKGAKDWTAEGWWTLAPDACTTLVEGSLPQRFYYFRVETPGWSFQDDKLPFCITEGAFRIEGDDNCARRGYRQENFARVDTGAEGDDYTHYLSVNLQPIVKEGAPLQDVAQDLGTAVFQGCHHQAEPYVSFCTFIGPESRYLVYDDGRTAPRIWHLLQDLPQGRRFTLTGVQEDVNEKTTDLVEQDVQLEPLDRSDRLLSLLQGGWQAEADADDQFRIEGAERISTYAGAETTVENIAIRETCWAEGGQGPYLYAWDTLSGGGLCYRIARVSEEQMTLVYLPQGKVLTFVRAH